MITAWKDTTALQVYYDTKDNRRLAEWLATYDPLTTRLDRSAAKLIQPDQPGHEGPEPV